MESFENFISTHFPAQNHQKQPKNGQKEAKTDQNYNKNGENEQKTDQNYNKNGENEQKTDQNDIKNGENEENVEKCPNSISFPIALILSEICEKRNFDLKSTLKELNWSDLVQSLLDVDMNALNALKICLKSDLQLKAYSIVDSVLDKILPPVLCENGPNLKEKTGPKTSPNLHGESGTDFMYETGTKLLHEYIYTDFEKGFKEYNGTDFPPNLMKKDNNLLGNKSNFGPNFGLESGPNIGSNIGPNFMRNIETDLKENLRGNLVRNVIRIQKTNFLQNGKRKLNIEEENNRRYFVPNFGSKIGSKIGPKVGPKVGPNFAPKSSKKLKIDSQRNFGPNITRNIGPNLAYECVVEVFRNDKFICLFPSFCYFAAKKLTENSLNFLRAIPEEKREKFIKKKNWEEILEIVFESVSVMKFLAGEPRFWSGTDFEKETSFYLKAFIDDWEAVKFSLKVCFGEERVKTFIADLERFVYEL